MILVHLVATWAGGGWKKWGWSVFSSSGDVGGVLCMIAQG